MEHSFGPGASGARGQFKDYAATLAAKRVDIEAAPNRGAIEVTGCIHDKAVMRRFSVTESGEGVQGGEGGACEFENCAAAAVARSGAPISRVP